MHRYGCKHIRKKLKPKIGTEFVLKNSTFRKKNGHLGNLRHDLSVNCWTSGLECQRNDCNAFVGLPNEILLLIISKLDGYSLKNIRKSCRKLHFLTDNLIGYVLLYQYTLFIILCIQSFFKYFLAHFLHTLQVSCASFFFVFLTFN